MSSQSLRNEEREFEHRIKLPKYTLAEELISSISHGLGAAFAVVALVLCLLKAGESGSGLAIVSSALYGSMLFLLYTMSTIYHALKPNMAKRVFRVFDHCTIFLLIAGTYIPIVLVGIGGAWGWSFFGVVVAAAILGIVFNAIDVEKYKKFSMVCYIAMGWVIVVGFKPLMDAVDRSGIALLIIGGIVYTIGAVIYAVGSKKKFFHSVWHFFVLGGSVLHFILIYRDIL